MLGTLIGNLNGDPFHVTTSFLDVSGDSIALLTMVSFHESFFFKILVVYLVLTFGQPMCKLCKHLSHINEMLPFIRVNLEALLTAFFFFF